jgi:hypothetical protein
MKIAIYTAATAGYTHALAAQARRVTHAVRLDTRPWEATMLMVTDDQEACAEAAMIYEQAGISVEFIAPRRKGGENYKTDAQLLIAECRQLAATRAMALGADRCWSLDSDVLPPVNSLRAMEDMLGFDGGWYGVSFCPYPSQGGGAFLGGHGTPQNPILPDFGEDEKDVPKEIIDRRKAVKKALKNAEDKQPLIDELHEIEKKIREIPPRMNVFAANGTKWRKRGWFDFAYPAIGRGAVVPVEWIGFGCTLMGREALALCDFAGYDGKGTEDLYICFRRWHPAGIRIACIPHCPCDHVIRDKDNPGRHLHVATGHADDPEHSGHLRQWRLPWLH